MKNWIVPIILCVVIGIAFLCQHNKIVGLEYELDKTRIVMGSLPEDIVTTSTMNHHVLTEIKRHAGTDSVYITTEYVPLESEIVTTVILNEEALSDLEQAQILLDSLITTASTAEDSIRISELEMAILNLQRNLYITEIEYGKSGWTLRPSIGIGFNTESDIEYSGMVRFYYWDRWGTNIYIGYSNTEDVTVGGSIDWRIPGWENISGRIGIGRNFTDSRWTGFIGIGIYLK